MAHRSAGIRRSASLLIASLALPGVVHGCSAPTQPPPPPGGGTQLQLSYEQFEQNVAPILTRHGCDAGGDCHGGGIRGTFELSPASAKDLHFDFEQTSLQVDPVDFDASPILTKPLALDAGGTPHGVKVFIATADSDYQAIHGWIVAGEPR